jgi:hypothetical protein
MRVIDSFDDLNISIEVKATAVDCHVHDRRTGKCRRPGFALVHINGGDCEDYIGRFVCRWHLAAMRAGFSKALRASERK